MAGNDTAAGRAANRRVELVVLADVAAALKDITAGADPPVGVVDPASHAPAVTGINYADQLNQTNTTDQAPEGHD